VWEGHILCYSFGNFCKFAVYQNVSRLKHEAQSSSGSNYLVHIFFSVDMMFVINYRFFIVASRPKQRPSSIWLATSAVENSQQPWLITWCVCPWYRFVDCFNCVLLQEERRKLAEIIRRVRDFSCFPGIPSPRDWFKAFSLTFVGVVY
jgi:hypothetical protein